MGNDSFWAGKMPMTTAMWLPIIMSYCHFCNNTELSYNVYVLTFCHITMFFKASRRSSVLDSMRSFHAFLNSFEVCKKYFKGWSGVRYSYKFYLNPFWVSDIAKDNLILSANTMNFFFMLSYPKELLHSHILLEMNMQAGSMFFCSYLLYSMIKLVWSMNYMNPWCMCFLLLCTGFHIT